MTENTENLEITAESMALLQIPSEHVGRSEPANLFTEMVLYGDQIKDGMIVLIADFMFRESEIRVATIESAQEREYSVPRYDEHNRWCRVTNLREHNDQIHFVGVYGDGTMRTRSYNRCHMWVVKKSSI